MSFFFSKTYKICLYVVYNDEWKITSDKIYQLVNHNKNIKQTATYLYVNYVHVNIVNVKVILTTMFIADTSIYIVYVLMPYK